MRSGWRLRMIWASWADATRTAPDCRMLVHSLVSEKENNLLSSSLRSFRLTSAPRRAGGGSDGDDLGGGRG
eukprot:4998158-Pyramimonas_sp.AAC.1